MSVQAAWHISSFSADGGATCVEAGPLDDGSGRIAVRHSKNPDGPVVIYTREQWDMFLAAVKDGDYDFHAAAGDRRRNVMAVGNPSVTDDATGELFVFDAIGFARFKAKYYNVQMGMAPAAFRVLVDAINFYKRENGFTDEDVQVQLLNSIGYLFLPHDE